MASSDPQHHVYATLLLSDSYLPGALVLAHSLRDAGTTKQLAVFVTLDSVSAQCITQLKTIYDHVIPVPRIRNNHPSNLQLMNRADLHSAFTKINLWKQLQFTKIVYIDADVVAYRAPDELFSVPHPFSAAPDIGWPDIFNTGVMVLTPNMGDYYAMLAMAERGISFDGADQGLLNMHFKNDHDRLSFTYNVTPSAHYQYVPAYRHFQSSINMVHFIGPNKPWFAGRDSQMGSGSPFDEMIGRWWAVYDRHYRTRESQAAPGLEMVQHLTKGEWRPAQATLQFDTFNQTLQRVDSSSHGDAGDKQPPLIQQPSSLPSSRQSGEELPVLQTVPFSDPSSDSSKAATEPPSEQQQARTEERSQPQARHISNNSWDAQRQPPPVDSQPEAMNFPITHYEMSSDARPFVPPARYPSPPKNMWYEVPRQPPAATAQAPKPIFPWEGNQPRPSRSFAAESINTTQATESPSQGGQHSEPVTPSTPTITVTPSDAWGSYSRVNAWDENPDISRYVEGLQKHRRVKSQPSTGGRVSGRKSPVPGQTRTFKLTDFPSAMERPSLPVTPAPVTREAFWGDEDAGGKSGDVGGDDHDDDHASGLDKRHFPTAQGVPSQTEWVCVHGRRWLPTDCPCHGAVTDKSPHHKDPQAQLQKLARQQSEALLRKLGGLGDDGQMQVSRDIPQRPLPFGSDPETSPTQLKKAMSPRSPTTAAPHVHSPRPQRSDAATGPLREMGAQGEAVTARAPPPPPAAASKTVAFTGHDSIVPQRGEEEQGEPNAAARTPALPTEQGRDIFET